MKNVSKSFAFTVAFAFACFGAVAAPTIVSPGDYATASSMSPFLQSFIGTTTMTNYTTYTTADTTARKAYAKDYKYTNGFVRLEWSGTSGSSTVTVRRLRDGATVFSETTDATSTLFYDPEIGRNYTWTVENGASTATGHFYVARNAPRIVHYKNQDGVYCLLNGRDMGGWTNTAGKVVKQGLLYRSAMVEYCTIENPKDGQGAYLPNDDLRNKLGIKLDVDLRETTDSWLNVFLGQDWSWNMSLAVSPIGPGIPRFFSENACGASFQDYKYANTASSSPSQTAAQNRAAMWHTFTNFCQEANMPILFHCMWGKDRTGTLGYILLGLLGVPRADLNRDWGLSWYAVSNESFVLSRWQIDDVYTFLQNYSGASLADKCESYLLQCASDAGVGAAAAQGLVNQFKALMLEDPEPKFTPADPGANYVPLSIGAPADYSTISTMTARMKSHLANASFLTYNFFKTANTDSSPNQTRLNYFHDYATNSVPTVLSWNGAGGPYTVKLWRTHIDSAETPVYVKETSESEAVFFDLEVGRNYTWTVTDGISTASGHFFTERNAPRIVYRKQDPSKAGSQGKNLRDMGGWTGANGKVVRQGLIFRSGQLEDCNASNDDGEDLEIDHLKYNLGIRFDLDFRTRAFMETFYTKPPEVEQSARWSWTHARPVIDMSNIGAGISRYNVNKETGYEFPSSVPATGSAQAGSRIAHWAAFTNLLNAAERPVLFHCSEGQDRTGAFGLVVLGILGVAKDDAKKDYGLSWCYNDDSAMTTSYGYKNFEDWVTRMGNYNSSATTLQAKSRAFLLQCAADAGDAAGAGDRIDAFIDMMLEDPETADTAPPPVVPDDPDPPTPPDPGDNSECALAIVSPADYSTIATKTPGFKSLVGDTAMLARSAFSSGNTAARNRYYNEYTTNSTPVELRWTATGPGTFTVKVWRTKDIEANPSAAPFFSAETEATSILYYDPEVGRNYTWTVSDGTSVATGHFFTEAGAPRVLYGDHNGPGNGADCFNGRDLGGWSAASGKVVRQGRVYRSAELDLCGPTNRFGLHTELAYLRDQIGIRLEMDLRNISEVTDNYVYNTFDWQGAVGKSCISPSIPRFNVEASCGTKFQLYDTAITDASVTNKYRKGVWSAFTNFCDEAKMPIVFHCAHGKDRAGTLGVILLGVLGVDVADVRRDFGLSWYYHKAETMDSGGYGYDKIDAAIANLATYAPGGTLAEQTEAYLVECALYSGVSAAAAAGYINTFRTLMLEDPETARQAPASPDAISNLSAAASYATYPEPKFTVAGSATLGSGTARVLVRYSLNSDALDRTTAVALQPDGTFSLDIPYAAASDELTWFVEAEDFGGEEVQIERTAVSVLRRVRDAAPVAYTWTGGAGDGKWTSLANWTCASAAAYGYPLDVSTAIFPAAAGGATIDLEGGTYATSLQFASGAGKIGFHNGTLLIDAASAALGATGTILEFGGATVGNASGTLSLTFPGGLSVRDGTLAIQGSASLGDVVFTDGQSEARLSVRGSLTLGGTCAMALKDAGRAASFIEAASAAAGSACTFELDVTERSSAGNVPLASFASSQAANLAVTLSTKIAGATVANCGALVWDGASLCYAQERQTGTAAVPTAVAGLVYNGAEQTGVPVGEGYTLSGTSAATTAGTYTVTATLKDGYSWAGQGSGTLQVQWSIIRGTNAWSPAPSISVPSWSFGETPGVLTPGRTLFGEATATISRNGGPAEAFTGILPEAPGTYAITYTAPEATADYAAPAETEKTVSFRIVAEPSGFDAYACYTTYPATFKVIGRITPGSGEPSVIVFYSLNSNACGESMQAELTSSGSFVCEIPYANAGDSLTWRAEATASDVDGVLSIGPTTITRSHDGARICYTWTGAGGDNRWTNIGNWVAEKPDCYGYPGFYDASWVSYVQFGRSTSPEGIDLEGGRYAFLDNGAFIIGQGITVKMKNGTLYLAGGLPTFNDTTVGLIGASGTTLVFENVKLDNMSSKNLIPAAGSTLVFEGSNTTTGGWKYNPTKANAKFVVRNGTLSGNAFGTGTIASSHVVEISNAVWSVSANISNAKSLAPKVIFRDGPDREAQFITTGSFLTYGRYDIRIPAAGRTLPAVKAKTRTGTSSITFDIDVTDYLSGDRVPLFQFTSTTAQTMPSYTLNVTAGGVDVKTARNASLVFESNTLYYVQDEQVVTPPDPVIPVADDNHTIICYGDSVTKGSGADSVTMDGRTNYLGGRLAGVTSVPQSYPYWLSGMLSGRYDVINQSRGSTLAAHVSSWVGVQEVSVKNGFTLPQSGSVTLSKKFVFVDSTYGNEYGGDPDDAALGGFVPPIYPLSENYAAGTTGDSIVGTLGGHRVRIQGSSTSSLKVTALDPLSADVAIAAGTKFIPESTTVEQYTNAVRIICMGGNDWIELRNGDYGNVDAYTYTYNTHIRPLAMKIKAQGGRFLIVSPVFNPRGASVEGGGIDSPVASEVETLMAADFGANYLNMRLAFVQNMDRLAQKLGIAGTGEWTAYPAAVRSDQVHLTSAGYKIKAALVREKLIELGYVTEVDRPDYTTKFPYDGTEKQCISEGTGYVIGGTYRATAGGTYQVQVSPAPGYTWTDGTTDPFSFEWLIDIYSVKVADVEALLQNSTYDGSAHSCGLASNAKYTVSGATSRTDAGTYSVTVTLNNGYTWDDEDPSSAKTFTWTIAKAANSWTAAPSISHASWTAGAAPNVTYSVGSPASGTAVNVSITKNGAAFNGTLAGIASWAMGFYNIAFSVAETANYSALETTLQVTILDAAPPETLDTTVFESHPEWGYKVENLGVGGDEVALVFTNHAATASWTVSSALENVQFLVVGGGGGGGADMRVTRTYDTGCGGGGGGGGGVVTGLVNFAKNSVVSVTVGHGGSGGRNGVSTCHKMFAHYYNSNPTKLYEAVGDAGEAADSSFSVGGLTYVTAYAGGGDQGGRSDKDCISNLPEDGGSGAGTRCAAFDRTNTTVTVYHSLATKGYAINDLSLVPYYRTFGNPGGENNASWSASGGGGAIKSGGKASYTSKKIASGKTRDVRYPGAGGEGLTNAITGTIRVYGSGGGGGFAINAARADATESQGVIYLGTGIGAKGGTGAGNGNQSIGASGTSGVANQGGGGGGGGLFGNGGSGGSGIVVFRFAVPEPTDPSAPANDWSVRPSLSPTIFSAGTAVTVVAGECANRTVTVNYTAAQIAALPPGTYTFRSTASADGVAPLVVEIEFTVLPDDQTFDVALFDEHPEWGYKVEGLGAGHDEMALVFTNQSATASWTLPADLENIRFLVVGGGGGGGADLKADDVRQAGAGGGGGGVVTGVVAQVAKDAVMTISVGAGGAGGVLAQKRNNNFGAAADGAASTFSVGGMTYVTALGGGGDRGSASQNASGNAGGAGGSSAGSRPGNATRTAAADTASCVNASVLSNIPAYGVLGNRGGAGNTGVFYGYYFNAGGGGGATEPGGDASVFDGSDFDAGFWGGEGGEGLASEITGTAAVYGSGGGGGSAASGDAKGAHGGTGAGNGNVVTDSDSGTDAQPNQGGGGGGGGRLANGGAGGSGIVVLRFRVPGTETPEEPELTSIAIPTPVTGLIYTGSDQTGVPDGTGYTVSDGVATGAGDHTATATLHDGYCWTGGSTDSIQISWSIAKAQNVWTTEPSISKATWATDETPGELTPAETFFGTPEASIAKDGGQSEYFAGTMPTEAGSYVITYFSGDEENWWGPLTGSVSVSFTITEPVIPEPQAIEITLFDEHPEWGYKVEGLGAGRDEVALVFTNQNASSMTWTVPGNLTNVQFLVVGGGGGGGGDNKKDDGSMGGAGGGGGGVVTGVVYSIAQDAVISAKVGAGGTGGKAGTRTQSSSPYYYGAGTIGSSSTLGVDGVTYVTANAGGRDLGAKSTSSSAQAYAGGRGGSSAGSRPKVTTRGEATKGSIGSTVTSLLTAELFGNQGGAGNASVSYASGGGGGATEEGGTPSDYYTGGKGGEGLSSTITGTLAVYGSGGGGGTAVTAGVGGLAGTGAGDGHRTGKGKGENAVANQGGGGGGGGGEANGGNGGSGIVVLRFRVPGMAATLPQVAGEDVEPAEVFTKARTSKSIVYPSEPTITGEAGAQVISFGGVDVNVPDYYTATLSGVTVTLALNANARPVIADEDETPGIAVVDGKVRIHLSNVKSSLYYTILSATSLDAGEWTPCGEAEQGQDDFEYDASGTVRFYKASVRDEAE